MSAEAGDMIRQLAHSWTALARTVQRARVVWLAYQGRRVPPIVQALPRSAATVRSWLQRFNHAGLADLAEKARPGRPARYPPEHISEVITANLTNPRDLGLPFARCTLDRLQVYLNEAKGIPIKCTRMKE